MMGKSKNGNERLFKAALRAEIADTEGELEKLRKVARALLAEAEGGNINAIREVADRLDGKVAQAISGPDEGPIEVEHSGTFDLSRLTEDELRMLEATFERLASESTDDNADD